MADTQLSKYFWFGGPVEPDYSVLEWQLPGVVVVLDATDDDPLTSADLQTERIAHVHAHGKKPTIVCIGNRIAADTIVDWMRQSIFAYAEANATKDRVQGLIAAALERMNLVRARFERFQVLNIRNCSLTQAEKQVLDMILDGVPNKSIATKLGVSQRTIEARRQKLYFKMGSKSLPGVVQSICEWRQLSTEFSGIVLADSMTDCDSPARSSNKERTHFGQSLAPPKLQSHVRQQKADLNRL